jgi:hypothetical protein
MKDYQKKNKISFFSFVAIIYIAFHTIDFQFVNHLNFNLEFYKFSSISKLISYLFIFALPFVFFKLSKIIYSKKLIFFFVLWIFFSTSLSFVISNALGYLPQFSNIVRTIEQIGGFIIGLVCGYYIFELNFDKSKIIVHAIKTSIFFAFIGIAYQIFILDKDQILISRLYPNMDNLNRLYGLSGEPKSLGLNLVPFIIASMATIRRVNYQQILIIIFCVLAMIYTKSATAFISFFFMILIFFLTNNFLKFKNLILLIFLTLTFIIIINTPSLKYMLLDRIVMHSNAEYTEGIQSVFNFPLVGQLTVEGNELPVLLFFQDNPFFIISGVGLGQESIFSYNYIYQLGGSGFLPGDYGGYITPGSAILQNIANFGLVMVLLLAIWAIQLNRKLNDYLEGDKKFIFFFFLSHFLLQLLILKTFIPISTSIVVLLSFIWNRNKLT